MQAYASAQSTPLESELRLAHVTPAAQAAGSDVNAAAATHFDSTSSPSAPLASLVLDGLDDRDLAVLAQRLLPHLRQPEELNAGAIRAVYTVASLAAELGVSQRTIRCAIARRELSAVKRGSRWIISAEAVHAWATASEVRRRTGRTCRVTAPKAAGRSLRSVLCGEASWRGAR